MNNDYQEPTDVLIDDEEMRALLEKLLFGESLSPEEIQAMKERDNAKRAALGILPVPEEYRSDYPTDMEHVEANPERYIVPECIPACKELWSKNIYTFMVCDFLDLEMGWAWICIKHTLLSNRNKEILASLNQISNVTVDTSDNYYEDTAYIKVPFVGQAAQNALLDIARRFEMQDVPEGYAYRVYNPDDPMNGGEILEDGRIYLSEYHLKKHRKYRSRN